jgi:hypothetical protein
VLHELSAVLQISFFVGARDSLFENIKEPGRAFLFFSQNAIGKTGVTKGFHGIVHARGAVVTVKTIEVHFFLRHSTVGRTAGKTLYAYKYKLPVLGCFRVPREALGLK